MIGKKIRKKILTAFHPPESLRSRKTASPDTQGGGCRLRSAENPGLARCRKMTPGFARVG